MLITFRRGSEADVDLLTRVSREAFDPNFGEGWTGAQLANAFSLPGAAVELALEGLEPISFALTRRVLDEAELLLIAVRPPWRRRGVAAGLIRSVLGSAASSGASSMFLEVRAGNVGAARLYSRLGFVPVGRRRDYYKGADGARYDAITMQRDLGTPQS